MSDYVRYVVLGAEIGLRIETAFSKLCFDNELVWVNEAKFCSTKAFAADIRDGSCAFSEKLKFASKQSAIKFIRKPTTNIGINVQIAKSSCWFLDV